MCTMVNDDTGRLLDGADRAVVCMMTIGSPSRFGEENRLLLVEIFILVSFLRLPRLDLFVGDGGDSAVEDARVSSAIVLPKKDSDGEDGDYRDRSRKSDSDSF